MSAIKKYLLLALLWVAPLLCFGQAQISNVRFEQSDDVVLIKYYIDLKDAKEVKNVKVSISLDGGVSYQPLTKVSGDVGTVKKSGEKQIIFDIFKELGHEDISGDIKFRVEGDEKYTSPYFKPFAHFIPVGYTHSLADISRFSIGYCYKWGAYFSIKWTAKKFELVNPEINFSNVDFNEKMYYRQAYNVGLMYHFVTFSDSMEAPMGLYLYGGLGYGEYGVAYEIREDVYYRPSIQRGMEVEVGIIFKLSIASFHFGYCTLFSSESRKQFADVYLGVGLNIMILKSK